MQNKSDSRILIKKLHKAKLWMGRFLLTTLLLIPTTIMAQSLTGTIKDTIEKGTSILMLILVGAAAWAGFEMKGGNPQGVTKLIYCITAIVIVGSANAIVSFFQV